MGRTYNDVVVPGRPMRATHISSIRTYIEQDQALVPPAYRYAFSWPNVQTGDPVLAKYFTEMRQAVQLLWDFKGRPPLPNWTSGVTPGGPSNSRTPTMIRATDVTDLRLWLNQYEDNHAPKQQGIDSKSYDPNYNGPGGSHPVVLDYDIGGDSTWNWVSDIAELTHDPIFGPVYVRTVISSPNGGASNPSNSDISGFNSAFSRYTNKNIKVYALLDPSFYTNSVQSLNDPLTNRTNEFINGFSSRAGLVSQQFSNVEGFILWNEPNVIHQAGGPPDINPENFAALLYQCRQSMGSIPKLYWGGIQFGPGGGGPALDYIDSIYKWYDDQFHVLDPSRTDPFAWPWSGINLHFHNDSRSESDYANIFASVRHTKVDKYGDSGEIIIGEWGVTQDAFEQDSQSLTHVYSRIISNKPDIMFFFAHHGVIDPVDSSLHWGIRDYVSATTLIQQPPGSNPLAFRLAPKAINGLANFYNAYNTLIGS
jgi:hypothetical protein